MIAIIDYNVGNIGAVENMLKRIGSACRITSNENEIEQAKGIVLPGNGAFDTCVTNLRESGLLPILEKKVIFEKIPLLGICVGAQMLGNSSEEGKKPGLGWIDMEVKRFPSETGLRVPHMGWREVTVVNDKHPLAAHLDEDARYYFVHSFYMHPNDLNLPLLMARYGTEFSAAVAQENIMGVQFHPEKSHRFGKALLKNFSSMVFS